MHRRHLPLKKWMGKPCAQEDRAQVGCHDFIPFLNRGLQEGLGDLQGTY